MGEIKSYKDLIVWQKSMDLVSFTYSNLSGIPTDETFGLISQIKRSSISIPSNIAEGYGRGSSKSYMHFLSIARGSLYELETQLLIALNLNFIKQNIYNEFDNLIIEIGKMINSLIKKLN